MTRRLFLKSSMVGAATAIAAPAIAQTRPNVKWRMVTSFPKSLDILYGAATRISKHVASVTDNNFQILTFAAGEIVPPLMVFDAVQNGTVECGFTPSFFYIGKDPTFAFDTAIPFGLNTRQQSAWVTEGGGLELMRQFYKKYNVLHFPAGNTGAQMGGWFRKEMNSIDDFRGVKMRVVGLGAQVLAKLGLVPQNIPPSDLYPALERGTIDAAEWIGPVDDERLGLFQVAKYYYYPGWWDTCAQTNLYINQKNWNELPESYQTAIATACAEAYGWTVAAYDARSPIALRRLVAAGAILKPFSQEILKICYKTAFEHYEEIAKKNEEFRTVYEPWKKFRSEIILWFSVAENSLDSFIVRAEQARRQKL
jgi:TRAP-type mannitol/chloroaromatic compound transport system substrate-binding protein